MPQRRRGPVMPDRICNELERFRERLKMLTVSPDTLAGAVNKIPEGEKLTQAERFDVIRSLERVWHIRNLMRCLAEFFSGKLVFGGGSVLNYFYMIKAKEPPRFTFDLDAAWHEEVPLKRVLLAELELFNKWLTERELVLQIPVGYGKTVLLNIVEYDAEKDHFPELLSLRIPVLMRYSGQPFYEFLEIKDYHVIKELRQVFKEVLGIKDPLIDYVRFEISLKPVGDAVTESLEDLFGTKFEATLTPVEQQLAFKILSKVARDFGPNIKYEIYDILKATLDLRLLNHVNTHSLRKYLRVSASDINVINSNLSRLLENEEIYEKGYHYILVRKRYSLKDIISIVKNKLQDLF